MTQQERTSWRDKELSERHRLWGPAIVFVDLDSESMQEYIDFIGPEATGYDPTLHLVADYKDKNRYKCGINFKERYSIKVQSKYSTKAGLPFAIVYYWRDIWKFIIEPVNELAVAKLKEFGINEDEPISERMYVEFLYWLRGLTTIPDNVLKILKD